jgi:hypothetical protein
MRFESAVVFALKMPVGWSDAALVSMRRLCFRASHRGAIFPWC